MPDSRDKWWTVTPGTPIDEVAAEMTLAIEEYGIPFLQSLSSVDRLLKHMLSTERPRGILQHPDICRAILLHYCGRAPEAARILTHLAESGENRDAAASTLQSNIPGHRLTISLC